MAKKRAVDSLPLETIWEVPDQVWEHMESMIAEFHPPAKTRRPRTELRKVMNGIIFSLQTGSNGTSCPRPLGTIVRCGFGLGMAVCGLQHEQVPIQR